MACEVQKGKKYKIITVQIAVDAEEDDARVSDEISAHLTENGICADDSAIADWQYVFSERCAEDYDKIVWPVVVATSEDEGSIFAEVTALKA